MEGEEDEEEVGDEEEMQSSEDEVIVVEDAPVDARCGEDEAVCICSNPSSTAAVALWVEII